MGAERAQLLGPMGLYGGAGVSAGQRRFAFLAQGCVRGATVNVALTNRLHKTQLNRLLFNHNIVCVTLLVFVVRSALDIFSLFCGVPHQ